MRRYVPALLATAAIIGLIAIGLRITPPDHDAALAAALADFASHDSVSGTIRLETLVPSDTLGIDLGDGPVIRLPIGLAGPFRFRMADDGTPLLAAELSLAMEGGETLPDAPGIDLISDGHGVVVVRPRHLPPFPGSDIDVGLLNGRWMRVTTNDFAQITGAPAAVPAAAGGADAAPKDADMRALKAMLAQGGMFTVDRVLPSEDLSGQATRHYHLVPDVGRIDAFAQALLAGFQGRDLTDAEKAKLAQDAEGTTLVAEAWLDRDADVLRRFGFDVRPLSGSAAAPVRVIIDITAHDTPMEDRVPENAEDLLDVVLKAMLGDRGAS